MKYYIKQKGFSLVEILITCFVFVLVIAAVFTILNLGYMTYIKGENGLEVLQNGRIVLERLTRELRQTSEIVTTLPQVPDNPDNPPAVEIEFADGHTPSPYQYLASPYYYIRYFVATSTGELFRQYKVYCFEDCASCVSFTRWNDMRQEGEEIIYTHACLLEERVVAEFVNNLSFWGAAVIESSIILQKDGAPFYLKTKTYGRNL